MVGCRPWDGVLVRPSAYSSGRVLQLGEKQAAATAFADIVDD
jgi:hypothetical protein